MVFYYMSTPFEIFMIRIKDHPVSEAYVNYCLPSWENAGFKVNLFDAITPETYDERAPKEIKWNPNQKNKSETEKACFASQYYLWKRCYEEDTPHLILEHDAYLVTPEAIQHNPYLLVQFFGQHAMEAVSFEPKFCLDLLKHVHNKPINIGPMSLVDTKLGFFDNVLNKQSRDCLPHSRYQGRLAPVKSVLDPKLGNTVEHMKKNDCVQNAISGKSDRDLFKIININDNI